MTPPLMPTFSITPWKINMEPENDGLEDDFPLQLEIFRFHVNLPGCIHNSFGNKISISWEVISPSIRSFFFVLQ